MDHQFLSIKQAAQRYAVSDVTLRRLAREITRHEGHEHRHCVRPGEAELKTLRDENKPFEYELNTELLRQRYEERRTETEEGSAGVEDTRSDVGSAAMGVLESMNDLLREQLKAKDEQIRQLNESLRAMQQQQNATSMILARLSDRIPLLSDGTTVNAESAEEKTVVAQTVKEAASKKRGKKPVKRKVEVKKKVPAQSGGVFSRWFRSSRAKAGAAK